MQLYIFFMYSDTLKMFLLHADTYKVPWDDTFNMPDFC